MRKIRVIGPPGTGKTSYGLSIVDDALKRGIQPRHIMYSSFTCAAANEARNRAMNKFPWLDDDAFPHFRTCHSIAMRLLGGKAFTLFTDKERFQFGKEYGYRFSPNMSGFRMVGDDLESSEAVMGKEDDYLEAFVQYRKNLMMIDMNQAYRSFLDAYPLAPDIITVSALKNYISRRRMFMFDNSIEGDFQDLLLKVLEKGLCPSTDLMIIDECQDNSPLMNEVFDMWAQHCQGDVYYIGDPDQCIYQWQGADPSLFVNMKYDEEVMLSQSYRVPKTHHNMAMNVIKRNKIRLGGEYLPTAKEGTIRRSVGLPKGMLVYKPGYKVFLLNRTRYLLKIQYDELISSGIPFSTLKGRPAPLQTKEGEAVYTFYRLLDGDEVTLMSLYRAIKDYLPARIYLKNKSKIERQADNNPDMLISKRDMVELGFKDEFMSQFNDFLQLLKIPQELKSYFRNIHQRYGRGVFESDPSIILSTAHGVKGMECGTTILNLATTYKVEQAFYDNPEAENRLSYVALTRATDNLILLESDRSREWPL